MVNVISKLTHLKYDVDRSANSDTGSFARFTAQVTQLKETLKRGRISTGTRADKTSPPYRGGARICPAPTLPGSTDKERDKHGQARS